MELDFSKKIILSKKLLGFLFLNIAFFISFSIEQQSFILPIANSHKTLFIILNLLYFLIVFFHSHGTTSYLTLHHEITLFKKRFAIFLISYSTIMLFLDMDSVSTLFHVLFISGMVALFVVSDLLIHPLIQWYYTSRGYQPRILVVGAGALGSKFVEHLLPVSKGIKFVGFLDDRDSYKESLGDSYLGSVSDIEKVIQRHKVDEVIISIPLNQRKKIDHILEIATKNYVTTRIVPTYHQMFVTRRFTVNNWSGLPIFTLEDEKLSHEVNQLFKRLFDIAFASLILLTVFPLLYLLLGPSIRRQTGGSVIFKQQRKGYRGKIFNCYKFRTMVVCDEKDEVIQSTPEDARKTKLGSFLRYTSLDEVPQFINVLKGEMSVVGPRPHMVEHDRAYAKVIQGYDFRFFAKPGVTGWAQINGYRGSTEEVGLMRKRVEHDIWYIANWSFWLDIQIIALTTIKVFGGDPNAY